MAAFIARRTLWMLLVLLLVSVVTFFLMRAIPGGPFDANERELPEAIRRNLEERYNMNAPLLVQYTDYVFGGFKTRTDSAGNSVTNFQGGVMIPRITDETFTFSAAEDYLVTIQIPFTDYSFRWGNFGPSLTQRSRTISGILRENLPVSIQLGLAALVVALIVGLPAGILSALNRNTVWDYVGMGIATLGVSVTVITLGPILQYIFGVNLGWFPISGWFGRDNQAYAWWQYMVLPAFALGFSEAALIARLTRASLLQVLNEDYIRTARAKGLHERRVITLHALKNALIPVVTILGPLAAALVTGSFVTEAIFAIPGIGEKFVTSITDRDYPLIMGTTLLFSFFLVVANMLVDLSYAWLDPRIRYT